MKPLYFVYVNGTWKRTTYDEYQAFDGRKEIRPTLWADRVATISQPAQMVKEVFA